MSSLLVFTRFYRMEIQSVMLVFLIHLFELLPLYLLSDFPHPSPLFPKWTNSIYRQCVTVWGGGGLSCVVDYILQEFDTDQIQNLQNYYTTPKQKH